MSRIGIFGGAFNPVHHGHLLAARAAFETLRLDQLVFMPCHRPAFKAAQGMLPAAFRLKLLRAALRGQPWARVDDLEIRRGGISYSIETLRALKSKKHRRDALFFLMGQDTIPALGDWREADELRRHALLCVLGRPGWQAWYASTAGRAMAKRFRLQFVPIPLVEISSSQIRHRLSRHLSISWMVPPACEKILVKQFKK